MPTKAFARFLASTEEGVISACVIANDFKCIRLNKLVSVSLVPASSGDAQKFWVKTVPQKGYFKRLLQMEFLEQILQTDALQNSQSVLNVLNPKAGHYDSSHPPTECVQFKLQSY